MKRHLMMPMLMGLLSLVGVSILPLPSAAGSTREAARASTMTLTTAQFESRLLARADARRQARGCRSYRLSPALVLAARRHSARMSYNRLLSHRLAGEGDLGARATHAGYTRWRMLAENLAWGQSSPRAVFRAWVNSPGHRANLDNCRLRDIGFGVVYRSGRPWVTADFGRRPS